MPGAIEIGSPVIGGAADEVLFVNALLELDQSIHFRYDKATGTLHLDPAVSDGRALLEIAPPEPLTPHFFIRQSIGVFGGHNDAATWIGSNIDSAGGALDPTFPVVAIHYENNEWSDGFQTCDFFLDMQVPGQPAVAAPFAFERQTAAGAGRIAGQVSASFAADLFTFNDTLSIPFLSYQSARMPGGEFLLFGSQIRFSPSPTAYVSGPITFGDGGGAAPTWPAGVAAEANALFLNFGVNDERFGARTDANAGAFFRVGIAEPDVFTWFARVSGSGGAAGLVASLSETGDFTPIGKFGCNTKAAQAAVASGGALAGYATGVFGLDSEPHMHALFDLVVAIRAALVGNGIMS